ncbi:MAG: glycosyltransferase [Prolixibacteraceae bacterium]|nr:glycosyltransferase [Prolixibacteraceae bacterium]
MLAPICLFTYNRLDETRQTVEALKHNFLASSSELIIFSDGPKNEANVVRVQEVRQYLRSVKGFKNITIKESLENKGLANSIINGVTQIIKEYGKVIVLEDDLISSPNFLNFMNQALDFYQNDEKIKSVNGYSLFLKTKTDENYFQIRPFPWGWATWEDRWDEGIFDKKKLTNLISEDKFILKKFNIACGDDISKMFLNSIFGKNDSWYVRWAFEHFRTNKYSIFPAFSLISNIGHNTEGTHCKGINSYKSVMIDELTSLNKFESFKYPDLTTTKEFLYYFSIQHKLLVRIKLLRNKTGRKLLYKDIISRIKAI